MNKESIIKTALAPFLKDAQMSKAMAIFHQSYSDITPYQIQRFVHEITQDEPTKEYRPNIRRSLMKALSDYQNRSMMTEQPTLDVTNLGQDSQLVTKLAAFELLIDSFIKQFSPALRKSIVDSVHHEIHQHSGERKDVKLGRKVKSDHALPLKMINFFDGFFYGDRQLALATQLTDDDMAGLRGIVSLFYLQACLWAGPSDADVALAQANKIAKGKFTAEIVEGFM